MYPLLGIFLLRSLQLVHICDPKFLIPCFLNSKTYLNFIGCNIIFLLNVVLGIHNQLNSNVSRTLFSSRKYGKFYINEISYQIESKLFFELKIKSF